MDSLIEVLLEKVSVYDITRKKFLLVCLQNNWKLVLHEAFIKFLHVEGLDAHSFRHIHATQLIESGANTKARLGIIR